jgi:hypothetical protein
MGVARLYKAASPLNAEELPEVDSVQSFDVLYMAHINHDPLKLTRTDHTSWEFSVVAFGPTAVAPSGVSATATNPNVDADNSGNAYFPQSDSYVVTTVDAATGQESRASTSDSATNDLTLKRNYNTIAWSAVAGAERYRIYKAHNGGDYGYVGSTTGLSFVDDNIAADMTVGPPEGRNPFAGDGDKPSTVTFFEARLWWGRTLNNPNALYSSRSADYENMDVSVPLRADDAITIRLVSQGAVPDRGLERGLSVRLASAAPAAAERARLVAARAARGRFHRVLQNLQRRADPSGRLSVRGRRGEVQRCDDLLARLLRGLRHR